ncbi:MAG: DUF885 domain-containing protein [Nitriliruptoraceae bacterium]
MQTASEISERLVRRYLDYVHQYSPVESTRIGLIDRDGELPDFSPEAMAARSRDLGELFRQVDAALRALGEPADSDEREARDDLTLLRDEVEFRRFTLDEQPRLELDPRAAVETIAASIHELLRRTQLDHDECRRRLDAAVERARRVPMLLEQAGSLLASAPAPHLDLAQRRIPDVIALMADGLPRRAEALGVDVAPVRQAADVAVEGLEAYAALLSELGDEPAADWRSGPHAHELVLRTALGSSMRANDVYSRAQSWRDEVRAEMVELASSTWTRRFGGEPMPDDPTARIRRTLSAISDTAVAPERFVSEARAAVTEARKFAEDAGFTDVPPAHRLNIEEVPAYLGGIAVAFIAPPPVLDPDAGCTFYLSPVPLAANDQQRQAFLREYHPSQLRSLAIHETYPGHFVQLEHASRHPRLARRLLTRPVFAEGWAVYIEREAVARGFPNDATSAIDPDDYRFTQRKLELRIATNAMLDVGLHAGDLDDPAAIELLTAGAFQAEPEAAGKLLRAKVSAGQLSTYFIGGEEFGDLRREVEQREGHRFEVRDFHQRVLSHGTPTVPIVASALADQSPVRRPFAVGVS